MYRNSLPAIVSTKPDSGIVKERFGDEDASDAPVDDEEWDKLEEQASFNGYADVDENHPYYRPCLLYTS